MIGVALWIIAMFLKNLTAQFMKSIHNGFGKIKCLEKYGLVLYFVIIRFRPFLEFLNRSVRFCNIFTFTKQLRTEIVNMLKRLFFAKWISKRIRLMKLYLSTHILRYQYFSHTFYMRGSKKPILCSSIWKTTS